MCVFTKVLGREAQYTPSVSNVPSMANACSAVHSTAQSTIYYYLYYTDCAEFSTIWHRQHNVRTEIEGNCDRQSLGNHDAFDFYRGIALMSSDAKTQHIDFKYRSIYRATTG